MFFFNEFHLLLLDHDNCTQKECQNGGTPINKHGDCLCICPNGFVGETCPKREYMLIRLYQNTTDQEIFP